MGTEKISGRPFVKCFAQAGGLSALKQWEKNGFLAAMKLD
jgi:hypothetical protein